MSIRYLGEQFDIHAGGIDHVPIHHTNEIAQSEAATGKHPWVRYWVHNEFLVLDKGKMSKSAGGFLTLQTLIDSGYDPLDYRYFLIGGHYRSQLQFSWDSLESAKNSRKSLTEKLRSLGASAKPREPAPGSPALERLGAFHGALDDDLSTPRALAELWGLLRDNTTDPGEVLWTVLRMDTILGLGLENALAPDKGGEENPEIEEQIARRAAAKAARDFALADAIRNELREKGIILEDGKSGTTWRRI
jgi:cysteinyl-tRNA synthetase